MDPGDECDAPELIVLVWCIYDMCLCVSKNVKKKKPTLGTAAATAGDHIREKDVAQILFRIKSITTGKFSVWIWHTMTVNWNFKI